MSDYPCYNVRDPNGSGICRCGSYVRSHAVESYKTCDHYCCKFCDQLPGKCICAVIVKNDQGEFHKDRTGNRFRFRKFPHPEKD